MKDDKIAKDIAKHFNLAKSEIETEEANAGEGLEGLKIQPCPHCLLFFHQGILHGLDKAMEVVKK